MKEAKISESKKRKMYPKEFVFEILAEVANIGISSTARKYQIPISTIGSWKKDYEKEYEEIKANVKDTFIIKANEVIQKYLEHLLDTDIVGRTTARDSAIVIGTLRDKISLEKGEPTERIESNEISGVLWSRYEHSKKGD